MRKVNESSVPKIAIYSSMRVKSTSSYEKPCSRARINPRGSVILKSVGIFSVWRLMYSVSECQKYGIHKNTRNAERAACPEGYEAVFSRTVYLSMDRCWKRRIINCGGGGWWSSYFPYSSIPAIRTKSIPIIQKCFRWIPMVRRTSTAIT